MTGGRASERRTTQPASRALDPIPRGDRAHGVKVALGERRTPLLGSPRRTRSRQRGRRRATAARSSSSESTSGSKSRMSSGGSGSIEARATPEARAPHRGCRAHPASSKGACVDGSTAFHRLDRSRTGKRRSVHLARGGFRCCIGRATAAHGRHVQPLIASSPTPPGMGLPMSITVRPPGRDEGCSERFPPSLALWSHPHIWLRPSAT